MQRQRAQRYNPPLAAHRGGHAGHAGCAVAQQAVKDGQRRAQRVVTGPGVALGGTHADAHSSPEIACGAVHQRQAVKRQRRAVRDDKVLRRGIRVDDAQPCGIRPGGWRRPACCCVAPQRQRRVAGQLDARARKHQVRAQHALARSAVRCERSQLRNRGNRDRHAAHARGAQQQQGAKSHGGSQREPRSRHAAAAAAQLQGKCSGQRHGCCTQLTRCGAARAPRDACARSRASRTAAARTEEADGVAGCRTAVVLLTHGPCVAYVPLGLPWRKHDQPMHKLLPAVGVLDPKF
jgi:hypothetical protein